MPQSTLWQVLRFLHKGCAFPEACELTDAELLDRFLISREESAFAVLVERHGPMILNVARRVLGDCHEAEDIFQAAFLVLARRGSSIGGKRSVGGWLHGVAQNIALKAKAQTAARRQRERKAVTMRNARSVTDLSCQELRCALDEAIGSLPEKYRSPIVLCYLEGKSHNQAAKELGWPKNSLTNRLTRARELLRRQLERRGIGLAVGAVATALAEMASAAPAPALLTINTVKAAALVAAGKTVAAGCLSVRALAMADEAVAAMVGIKGQLIVLVLVLGLAIGGAGWAGYSGPAEKSQEPAAVKAQPPAAKDQVSGNTNKNILLALDQYGDPLPPQALARLGTTRLRHAAAVSVVFFSRDGKTLISGGWDNVIHFWDPASGREVRQIRKPVAPGRGMESIYALALSPDGKYLAAGGWGPMGLWETYSGRQLWLSPILSQALAYSPDGKTLASVGISDSSITLINASTGEGSRTLTGHSADAICVAFSPDGKTLASGSKDKTLRLWDLGTGKELRQLPGHQDEVKALAFSPDGKLLASGSADKTVRLWDVATGKTLHQCDSHQYGVDAIAFSGDGESLASAGHDKAIYLWKVATGKQLRRFESSMGGIRSIAFSPDDTRLAAGSYYQSVQLWDVSTGQELVPLGGHGSGVNTIAFAPDGRTLASAGWDRIVRLWDVPTAKELRRFAGHENGIRSIAFSPSGKTLASAAQGDTLRQWDVGTGNEDQQFRTKFNDMNDGFFVAFSPDGQTIAVANGNASIVLRDAVTGKELRSLAGHAKGPVYTMAFSPDGKTLVSGALD